MGLNNIKGRLQEFKGLYYWGDKQNYKAVFKNHPRDIENTSGPSMEPCGRPIHAVRKEEKDLWEVQVTNSQWFITICKWFDNLKPI